MARKPRPTDEELLKLSHEDFVVWFIDYNQAVINRYISRRLIPNRYDPNDIKAYMAERMLDVLKKRLAKGRPIANPRIYFGKLIDYWCIEYQRMHGYIYGMPKRPRCAEAEQDIAKYGFVYLSGADDETGPIGFHDTPQMAYVDVNLNGDNQYTPLGFNIKGEDPGRETDQWKALISMVLPEDRSVINCLFRMNMTVPEASRHLGISLNTAYQKRDRALVSISGTLASFLDLDQDRWKLLTQIGNLEPSSVDITELFQNLK